MNESFNVKVNYLALFVIVFYPIILLTMAIFYSREYGFGKFEILSIIITYYIVNISVGVGLHRLWSHAAFKTKKVVELFFAFLTASTLQGPILAWASDHMLHHAHTDTERDPHTALKYNNKFIGFLWSHIGWMIFSDVKLKKIDRLALAKLSKNKIVMWQFKNYWQIATFMNTVVPLAIGYAIGGDFRYAIGAFIFMGLGRAIQQQATFCVNSIVHMDIGTKEYYYGTARDIYWLFFLLLGENWHNFHHAFANDYRNGHKWYQLDIHKWIIAAMSKLGLATDLVVTSKLRIDSMKKEVQRKTFAHLQEKLDFIEKTTKHIHLAALNKLKTAEKSATLLASDWKENLHAIIIKAKSILVYAQNLKLETSNLEECLVMKLTNKYDELINAASKLKISVVTL
jgi:stearoyl-CoA desaturase (delta-9 desaturase)